MAKSKKSKSEGVKKDSPREVTESTTVPGVVDDLEQAAQEAHDEAVEAGVTPAAVMRTTPEAGVTGDGAVSDPSGEHANEKVDVDD